MKISELPKTDAKLQLLCHQGNVNFVNDDPNTEVIDSVETLAMATRIHNEAGAWEHLLGQKQFIKLLRLVFSEKDFPVIAGPLGEHGNGFRHVVGLIVLVKSAQMQGKRAFIRFPESYLHPSAQLGLGDLLAQL